MFVTNKINIRIISKHKLMAKINLKIWGVKGGNPQHQENKGSVSIFLRDDKLENIGYINADAFNGAGETYQRRDSNIIEIFSDKDGVVFEGTFGELVEILKNNL